MKNIEKMVKKRIAETGGKQMKANGISDPRFSKVTSSDMFPKKKKEPEDKIKKAKQHEKDTDNPSKNVKRLKHVKGVEK